MFSKTASTANEELLSGQFGYLYSTANVGLLDRLDFGVFTKVSNPVLASRRGIDGTVLKASNRARRITGMPQGKPDWQI